MRGEDLQVPPWETGQPPKKSELSFSGRHGTQLDAKGRTSVPTKLKEILSKKGEDRLVVTTGIDEECLVAHTPVDWQHLVAQVDREPMFDEYMQVFRRFYIASAAECPLDKQGRILIPNELREYAGLKNTRELFWLGMGRSIEIWSRQKHLQAFRQSREMLREVKKILALKNF